MEYIKEELENLILNQRLSYREIGRRYGVSDTYIKRKALELGINLEIRARFPKGFKPANRGLSKYDKKECPNCNKVITVYGNKYCDNKCQGEHKSKEYYLAICNGDEKYQRGNYSPTKVKPFILKEQDCKCAICNMENVWNGKELVFVLDHIDGNAANNTRDNLRLVCHNCDSQLDTYKSKNKGSARKERYLMNYK